MYNEIKTPPTVRNHNKSTIKQNVWLYDQDDYEKLYVFF